MSLAASEGDFPKSVYVILSHCGSIASLPARCCMWAEILAPYIGGLIGAFWRPSCRCEIVFGELPSPSKEVLALLGHQLERCGPTQLGAAVHSCPKCPACPQTPVSLILAIAVLTFVAGVVTGLSASWWLCVEGRPQRHATVGAIEERERTEPGIVATPKTRRCLSLEG